MSNSPAWIQFARLFIEHRSAMESQNSHHDMAPRVRLLVALIVCIVALGVVGAYVIFGPGLMDFAGGRSVSLGEYPYDTSGVPAELKRASLVDRGKCLARAADCVVCHTRKGGIPYAGGVAFVLPFGTLYSTNITPDAWTGIGKYTDRNFLDAIHKGIGRRGDALYPGMPYPSYTYMSDSDALAIKAFLFSLPPIHAPARPNTLVFPFNQRVLMRIWAALFNPDRRFEPRVDRSPEWNRGAYLVEVMEHCGECHTPRNLAFALDNRRKFTGEVQGGWRAYNITPDRRSGVGDWTEEQLTSYLRTGHAAGHGTAAGPMGEAVDESISGLAPSDITAMVMYLRTTPRQFTRDLPSVRTTPAAKRYSAPGEIAAITPGRVLYAGACAGCHGWNGIGAGTAFATLTGSRAVNDPTGTNVAQVIIGGARRMEHENPIVMPSFGRNYSDWEIANLSNYVTARFGSEPSHLNAARVRSLRALD